MRLLILAVGTSFAVCCIALAAHGSPDLRLTADGTARVTVVVPENAGRFTRPAVDDLVRCLSAALGTHVPTASTTAEVRTPLSILLGDAFGADFQVCTSGLHRDGCVIKTRGKQLLITGPSDYGIANGIYTFLIDCVGVRWFAPGDLYEVIPKKPDLTLPNVDIVRNPDFSYRVFSGVTGDAGRAWLRRSRLDLDTSGLPCCGFGHNLSRIIRPSLYGKDHPEYFAMVDGKRMVVGSDDTSGPQPCFTNPDVIRIAADAAKEFFAKNPDRTTFSLGVNDGPLFCRCPNCAALDQPQRKSKGSDAVYSDSFFYFVTEVAKIVARSNPDRYLGCYAYRGVELPPRRIPRLPDNVTIALTQDTSQHFDPDYKQTDRDLWLAWRSTAAHVGKYDYYGLGWFTPRYFVRLAADDIKFIHANSAAGFYCEVYPNWSVTAPQLYVASRLLWDSSLDTDTLLDEYFNSLFGPAAGEMKRFYSLLEQYWAKPRPGRWFEGFADIKAELAIADADLIEQAWQYLFKARTLVIGREAERVADVQDHFRFTYEIVRGCALARKLGEVQIKTRDDAAQAVGDMLGVLKSIAAAERVHKEKWLSDPRYSHVYYQGPRFEKKFRGWEAAVADGIKAGIERVCEFGRTKLPQEEFATILADLRSRLSADPVAERLRLLDSVPQLPGSSAPPRLAAWREHQ